MRGDITGSRAAAGFTAFPDLSGCAVISYMIPRLGQVSHVFLEEIKTAVQIGIMGRAIQCCYVTPSQSEGQFEHMMVDKGIKDGARTEHSTEDLTVRPCC